MQILDRYVWKELTVPCVVGLFVFTFLLLIDRIFDMTDLIINKGVPAPLVFLLLAYIVPSVLVLTVPVAFLLAILVAFGRLSADMEIVALRASGVSALRLLRPVLVAGAVVTVLTGVLMTEGMPRGNFAFKALIFDILRTQATVGLKERVFNDAFGDFVIYVDELAVDQVSLRHVFVSDERKPDELRLFTAREGRLFSDEASRRTTLRLLHGAVHETRARNPEFYRRTNFGLYDLTLVLDSRLGRQGSAPKGDREMTLPELATHVREMARAGGNPNPYLVEIHKKYAIPAACLVFALLGVPLGIRAHRGGRWAAFVLFVPIVLFYHVAFTLGETLGDAGRIPPWLAMWGPNLVAALVGGYLLWMHVKERPIPLLLLTGRLFWTVVDHAPRVWRLAVLRSLALLERPARRRPRSARVRRGIARPRVLPRTNALNLVDWYLIRQFLALFVYGLVVATLVVVVADLMTTVERYVRLRTPLVFILEHFLYRIPPFVYQGLHLVVLMSTILLFLSISRSNELTALKAGGVSLYRVSLPVFGLAGVVTLGGIGFQELVLPVLNQRAMVVDEAKIKRRTLPELRKRTQLWYRSRDPQSGDSRIYYINLLDPSRQEMSGVAILELDPAFSLRGRWDARGMRWTGSSETWELRDGWRREFRRGADRTEPFPSTLVRLPERFADFTQIPRAPDVMNYFELRDYIQRLQDGGHKVGKYLVDLYSKVAFPFAHVIMALVGIPFALQSPRSGRVIGIALCLALGLGYFVVHAAAVALARTEVLPPVVAAWAANVLFATLGLYLFLRAPT